MCIYMCVCVCIYIYMCVKVSIYIYNVVIAPGISISLRNQSWFDPLTALAANKQNY